MPAATCSDAEFMELWRTHGGADAVAKALGLSNRAIHQRRRSIERRHNQKLVATAHSARGDHYKHLSPYEHKANHHLGLLNGIVIVFSDAHFVPGIRTTANKGLLRLIRELKPKAIVNGGDSFDGAQISRFPRPGFLDQGPTVIQELNACKERLGEIEEAGGRAKLVWCLGNHDLRLEARLAMNVPQFEGVHGFHLKDHFPTWIPAWCCWVNDDTMVAHRYKNGIHATHTNAVNAGVNIVTGHLHQLKVTPFRDFRSNRYGVDSGTLAEPMGPQFVNYLEGKMPNWRSGFVVLTFKDGQLLMPQLAQKWDEKHIEFAGRLIDVSRE
jgi:hypothetical protein